MDVTRPLALLGGLSPATFMRRHWQKKPLLVRQAWPGIRPPISRAALFELASAEGVESRLLTRFGDAPAGSTATRSATQSATPSTAKSATKSATPSAARLRLRHGPFGRRALPPVKRPNWTLLLQGLDLHCQAAHELLQAFRFMPEARLDDLMISWASDGGGVGPHLDSYDVFLLQVQGQRRWRIGPVADRRLVPGLPVRILAHFEPTEEWLLAPGDMLYLPPQWGHDGTAEGECMTCSIGFRAASAGTLAQELLHQIADGLESPESADALYRDAGQPATSTPGRLPVGLRQFAEKALQRALRDPRTLDHALGQLLTEPKPQVWFDAGTPLASEAGARLDRRSRMLYDDHHVFINGEAFVAGGRDARLMQQLADQRQLPAAAVARLSGPARALLGDWADAGWVHSVV